MIIKDIAKQEIPEIGNILPLKKNNIFPIRIDKTIEIVTVPKLANKKENQKNVGIVLEEKIILKILSKRYKNVLITEINTEKDLEKLVIRKPDLVFSGVKYFYFNSKIIWLNDYLEMYDIPYIASSKTALDKESDKNKAKKIMQKAKIKTADFFITTPGKHSNELSIPIKFPVFIKPVTGGDSRGIDLNSIAIEFKSIPLLSPPVTGFIKTGNFIGIDNSFECFPGVVIKKSAVLILAFCIIFFALFLSLSLSNAVLLEAI